MAEGEPACPTVDADRAPAGAEGWDCWSGSRVVVVTGGNPLTLKKANGPSSGRSACADRMAPQARSAAADLARDNLELGNPRQALAAAQTSVQLDRYQDLAWKLLVALHEASGDSSAAASARHEHAKVQAELGVTVP